MRLFILLIICYPLYAMGVKSSISQQAWEAMPNKTVPEFLDSIIITYPQSDESVIAFNVRFRGVQASKSIPKYHDFITRYSGTLAAEQAILAKLHIEKLAFELFVQLNEVKRYDDFAEIFPMSVQIAAIETLANKKALAVADSKLEALLVNSKEDSQELIQKRNNSLAAKMEANSADKKLVERYCYILGNTKYTTDKNQNDHESQDAIERCYEEKYHQAEYEGYSNIQQAVKYTKDLFSKTIQEESAKTNKMLRDNFKNLHLDNLQTVTKLDDLQQHFDKLHTDFVETNENLVKIYQNFTDVKNVIAKTNEKLALLHQDFKQIHISIVKLNQEMNQNVKPYILQEIISVTQKMPQTQILNSKAIVDAQNATKKAIGYKTMAMTYSTERILFAERQQREYISQFIEQVIDAIKPGQGCGDEGRKVPDSWGDANFYPACQAHDKCYECGGGESQRYCDDKFDQTLTKECNSLYFGVIPCKTAASLYYLGTTIGGKKAWKEARKNCI